jgi:hypothetical protein
MENISVAGGVQPCREINRITTERGPPGRIFQTSGRFTSEEEDTKAVYVVMNSEQVKELREQKGMSKRDLAGGAAVFIIETPGRVEAQAYREATNQYAGYGIVGVDAARIAVC